MGFGSVVVGEHVGVGELVEGADNLRGLVLDDCEEDEQVGLGDGARPPDLLHHLAVALDRLEDAFDQPHYPPRLLLATAIPPLCLLEVDLHRAQVLLEVEQEALLVVEGRRLALSQLLPQTGNFKLEFLDFVALEVDELEHLEVLLLIPAEDAQQLVEVVDLRRRLDLREVLPELLDLLHLF